MPQLFYLMTGFSDRFEKKRLAIDRWLLALLLLPLGLRAQSIDTAGGILSPENLTVPAGNNSGKLVLGAFYGTILRYQADTGSGFVDIAGPASEYVFYNLQTTTRFRAVVKTPSAVLVTSTVATVTVVSPTKAVEEHTRGAFENRQANFAPALALKFSPLATLDPTSSSLLMGLEYRRSPRYGVEASYGHSFDLLRPTTLGLLSGRYDYTFHKFKLEMRRYLEPRTRNPNQETYFAVQGFFMPQRYTRYGNNFFSDGHEISYDRAFVSKDVMGVDVKVGSLWHLWTRWLVEAGLGAGARYVDTRYDMLNERRASNFTATQSDAFNQIELPGTKVTIDVELVFKVGYSLSLEHH